MPRNSNGLQVVRAQVRFFQSVPRSEETHDLSVVKQWIGWTSCKKIEKGLVDYDYTFNTYSESRVIFLFLLIRGDLRTKLIIRYW